MPMEAGKLRNFITIQQQSGARDTTGEETDTWTTFAQVYAHIEPYVGSARAGREMFQAGQLVGLDYTRIHLRYLAGITPKMRVSYNGRIFDILAINNRDERNAELEMIAKERQGASAQ
jgi:SPP1 family predicted phage head-tail adaptor